ncbi:MAG: tRNA lysidine(34) synthetase TilS [Lysobacterales bacterium]|nr:MAG: tRNA lysidine(34) synthetase TilS [Xanthomonadales bacterium]
MQQFSPQALARRLRSLAIADDASLCVAFSGGLDSTVLLHALTRIAGGEPHRLRAAHIDHQLHADSARWRAHCEATAEQLGVRFAQAVVHVECGREGLEAAARRARYAALRELMQEDEILLTAHHADDQLETMLLGLVRGAGVAGLSGIPHSQPFGSGSLVRPLLEFTRAELEGWARAEGLVWLEDPSNDNIDLDRNYLRRSILPALRQRWPAAARSASRAGGHLEEAGQLLATLARTDLATVAVDARLDVARLLQLYPVRRSNVLRYWIRQCGARTPSTRKLAAIEHDLLPAAADRTPCVEWDDVELRRYRGLLYLDRRLPAFDSVRCLAWDPTTSVELPSGLGRLRLQSDPAGGLSRQKLASTLEIRFRAGGETLRPSGDAHRRSLKKMLQASGVPPWRRDRMPLIYSDERLAAVGDLWVAQEFAAQGAASVRIVWEREAV